MAKKEVCHANRHGTPLATHHQRDSHSFFKWDPKSGLDVNAQSAGPTVDAIHMVRDARVEGEKSTLAQVVYDRMKEDIFDFRMAPGQRYSEQELANRLGVSRTPLRFALHILAREGYLQRVEGHTSWQVRPFELSYFEDLYDFRVQIEVIAVRRLCAMDPAPDLSELCAFWCVPRRQRAQDGQTVARQDEKLHSTLVALAGNREMARTHTDLTERIRIIRRLDFIEPARIKAAFDEHDKILAAVLARRAGDAEMLIKAHIGASRAEIRHLSLHRLALATQQAQQAPLTSRAA
jgi:DNA-binding GntR family transcriptional regulator